MKIIIGEEDSFYLSGQGKQAVWVLRNDRKRKGEQAMMIPMISFNARASSSSSSSVSSITY